jgi:multicomponent Na+:H+ antiporter subunit E
MTLLALNLLLALAWSALFGGFSRENLALGFAVGFVALWLVQPLFGPTRYFGKLADVTRLLLFFAKELVVSSLRVVSYVFLPASRPKPGILALPLEARTDLEITLLANLISLTPGSLSLELSDDRRTLFVHCMDVDDPDALRRELKEGMERRVLETLR